MTDREKMQSLLNQFGTYSPSFKEIIVRYLSLYPLSLIELYNIIETLQNGFLSPTLRNHLHYNDIARENAQYVCAYLKGELYTDEEYAKKCLPLQIEHAEKVVRMLDE